jgi:hypothetical protein
MVGRTDAQERGLDLTRSSSARELACGIDVHFPDPSKRHAW